MNRQIAHDQGLLHSARDGPSMMHHLSQRHLRGVFISENHHAQGIAHQDDVDPAFVEQPRSRIIVGGQGRHPLAPPFSVAKILHGVRLYHSKSTRTTAVASGNRRSKTLTDSVCFGRTKSGLISASGRRTNSRSAMRGWGSRKAPVSISSSPK